MMTTPGTKPKTFACPRIMNSNPPLEHQHWFSEKELELALHFDFIEPCKFNSSKTQMKAKPGQQSLPMGLSGAQRNYAIFRPL